MRNSNRRIQMIVTVLALSVLGSAAVNGRNLSDDPSPCPPIWSSANALPGTDADVRCSFVWTPPDRPGESWLVIGGVFSIAGDVVANHIAAWDGRQWHTFGAGFDNTVSALGSYNGELIAGGQFTMADGHETKYIARWDGTTWQPMGTGMNDEVRALHVFEGDLIAGGYFTTAGDVAASKIARWSGTRWQPMRDGFGYGVECLTTYKGELYAGGNFGGTPARWDGQAWRLIEATCTLSGVYAMIEYQGDLIIAGIFNVVADGAVSYHIAKYDGARIVPFSTSDAGGINGVVLCMVVAGDGELLVGGYGFSPANDTTSRWTGSEWLPVDEGVGGGLVHTFSSYKDKIVAGGQFGSLISQPWLNNLAEWTGLRWDSLNHGMNNSVDILTTYRGQVIAGGTFTQADSQPINHLAYWAGSTWEELGGGLDGPPTCALEFGGELIVGGTFASAGDVPCNNVARWNGSQWSPLGGGFNFACRALTIWNDQLIGAGRLPLPEGGSVAAVARWNGLSWEAMGSFMPDMPIRTLGVFRGELYAAGDFTTVAGQPANRIARWDGSQWVPLPTGLDGPVLCMAVYRDELVVGGTFTTAGATVAHRIARFDGTNWRSIGIGLEGGGPTRSTAVRALAVADNQLLVGGTFTSISLPNNSSVDAQIFASWDGGSWHAFVHSLGQPYLGPPEVNAITFADGRIIVGGVHQPSGGLLSTSNVIGIRPELAWQSIGNGFDYKVSAMAASRGEFVVAGNFMQGPGEGQHYIAASEDGVRWHDLGGGMNGPVAAVIEHDGNLVAAGSFTLAGNKPVTNLAKWNGVEWSQAAPLDDSYNQFSALLSCPGKLYVAGSFQTIDGVAANSIALWDGTQWSALDAGLGGTMRYGYALTKYGSDVIVGGWFTSAGGVTANNIAAWDDVHWRDLDGGVSGCTNGSCNPRVWALTTFNNDLIVAGEFQFAGSVPAKCIARWDGRSWHALGGGFNGAVYAVAVFNGQLYATGSFTTADGLPAVRAARWDGQAWHAIDSGLNPTCPTVYCTGRGIALAAFNGSLYLGGDFSQAGSVASAFIARIESTCAPGDINSDGQVNVLDLLAIISRWGPCLGGANTCHPANVTCDADINLDATVNALDLISVIEHWN